ncbi:MAG: pseudaminic acid biosynthesis-associated methylase, partial [Trebonia sp.]
VLISGVLIHIAPDQLQRIYERLHMACGRYLLLAEYYNPSPVEVEYRGHSGRLFKRDFAGELMDRFADLRLRDYGFAYHRDPLFPADDVNWFLLERMP